MAEEKKEVKTEVKNTEKKKGNNLFFLGLKVGYARANSSPDTKKIDAAISAKKKELKNLEKAKKDQIAYETSTRKNEAAKAKLAKSKSKI